MMDHVVENLQAIYVVLLIFFAGFASGAFYQFARRKRPEIYMGKNYIKVDKNIFVIVGDHVKYLDYEDE